MTITTAEVALRGKDQTAAAFRSVIRNAETAQKQISTKLRSAFNLLGIGTAIYGLTRAVTGAIKAGDDLAKFAEKTGLAAEAASELTYAAKIQDIELASLATSIKKMQVTLSEAGSGGKPALSLLKALGIELEHIKGLKTDQQFELFAEQISKLKDPADRTRAAVEAFGRAGADLLPMFEQGAEGIRKLRAETPKVFTAADLKRLSDADDAMKRLKASTSAFNSELALLLSSPIGKFFDEWRIRMGGGTERENAITQIEQSIDALVKAGVDAGPQIDQLRLRLELLMNPMTGSKRGRGAPEDHPVIGFLKETEKQAKLTKKELEDLERYLDQGIWGRTQEIRLEQPMGGSPEENAAEIRRRMEEIHRETVPLRDRTIELGTAFEVADENAKGLIETLKDESARRGLDAISDAIMGLSGGAKEFAKEMLNAFRRILADYAAQQIIALLTGKGGTSGSSSGGWIGAIASGIGALLGGSGTTGAPGSMTTVAHTATPRAGGGSVTAGSPYLVGEAGPELFMPNAPGSIKRAGSFGGTTFAPSYTINIDSRADRTAIQQDMAAFIRENNRQMIATIRDMRSRGATV